MQFHHLDPSKKVDNVSAMARGYSLKKIAAEMSKCIVLCANCHAIETFTQRSMGAA